MPPGSGPLVDSDSYLLMSPGPESAEESVFSPRPAGAASRTGAHFEFPPPPQLARQSPPSGFYNPSSPEAGRGRVPSTPKMGTRVSRPARPAAEASEEHYRVPSSPGAALDEGRQRHLRQTAETGGALYRVPVPVGCEQLA